MQNCMCLGILIFFKPVLFTVIGVAVAFGWGMQNCLHFKDNASVIHLLFSFCHYYQ